MPVMSWPSISIRPAVGASKPASILRSVDLPQPDPPSRQNSSPFQMSRLTSSTAVKSPNFLVIFSMRTNGRSVPLTQGLAEATVTVSFMRAPPKVPASLLSAPHRCPASRSGSHAQAS
jgi:hypothetical protein